VGFCRSGNKEVKQMKTVLAILLALAMVSCSERVMTHKTINGNEYMGWYNKRTGQFTITKNAEQEWH
jgi:hypothetical protein